YVIDTNGDAYSVADTYDSEYCHGNLLRHSGEEIIYSQGRRRAITAANQRMRDACDNCCYFGACSGWPMAEATTVERRYKAGRYVCEVVKPTIEHARAWVLRLGSAWANPASLVATDVSVDEGEYGK